MKLKHFYLALESNDFSDTKIVADFNFQTYYLTHFIEKKLVAEKFEADKFQFILLRARENPSKDLIFKEYLKALEIEVSFNQNRYIELYPFKNNYPLEGLLKPILKTDEFNDFLFEMIMEGLVKAKNLKAPIPYDFLINTVLDFKANGFKNEWIYKTKTFKELSMKASLLCKLTCNYFSLEVVLEKDKKEIFRKEILKTLPHASMYQGEFKDIIIENNILKVIKDDIEKSVLYEAPLSELISNK